MEAFQIVNRLMSINGSALSNVQFLKVTISLVRNLAWSDRRIGDFSGRRSDRSSIAVATTELGGCPGVTVNSRLPTGPIGHAPGASGKHLIRRYLSGVQRRPDQSASWHDRHSSVQTRSPGGKVVRSGGSQDGSQ
jgi:hypothetical protein